MAAPQAVGSAILLFASGGPAHALATALEGAGHRVSVAAAEEEALQALEDADFALVLVHLSAADPERLDVIKLLRMGDPSEPGTPVIVLADAPTAEIEQACADARIDLRLMSPVEPQHLLESVADLLASGGPA